MVIFAGGLTKWFPIVLRLFQAGFALGKSPPKYCITLFFDWKLLLWLQSSDWQSLLKFQESKQEVPQNNSISCLPNVIQTKPTYWTISYLPKNLAVAEQNSRSQHIQFYLVKVRHIIIQLFNYLNIINFFQLLTLWRSVKNWSFWVCSSLMSGTERLIRVHAVHRKWNFGHVAFNFIQSGL